MSRLHDEVFPHLEDEWTGDRRLVVIGGPGSGKTTALLALMFGVHRARAKVRDPYVRASMPVPVWLQLVAWDPGVQSLQEWVTDSVVHQLRGFGSRALVEQFFDESRLLLFLDGLDEMPAGLREQALLQLGEKAPGGFVLTSDTDVYRTLGRLPRTGVIELEPVPAADAADYLHLKERWPDDQVRWQPLAQHLLAEPDGPVARSLSTPAVLSMTRAAYAGLDTDPTEVLASELVTADQVTQFLADRLIDRYFEAAYPDGEERERANYWLGWLAHEMGTRSRGGARCRDLLRISYPTKVTAPRLLRYLAIMLAATTFVIAMRGRGTGDVLWSSVLGIATGTALASALILAGMATLTALPVVRAWRDRRPQLDLRVATIAVVFRSRAHVLLLPLVRKAARPGTGVMTLLGDSRYTAYRFWNAAVQDRLAERFASSSGAATSTKL